MLTLSRNGVKSQWLITPTGKNNPHLFIVIITLNTNIDLLVFPEITTATCSLKMKESRLPRDLYETIHFKYKISSPTSLGHKVTKKGNVAKFLRGIACSCNHQ